MERRYAKIFFSGLPNFRILGSFGWLRTGHLSVSYSILTECIIKTITSHERTLKNKQNWLLDHQNPLRNKKVTAISICGVRGNAAIVRNPRKNLWTLSMSTSHKIFFFQNPFKLGLLGVFQTALHIKTSVFINFNFF